MGGREGEGFCGDLRECDLRFNVVGRGGGGWERKDSER